MTNTEKLIEQAIEKACFIDKDKIRKDPRYQKRVQFGVDDSYIDSDGTRVYPDMDYDTEQYIEDSGIKSAIKDMITEDMKEIGKHLDEQPHPHDLNMEYQREVLG
jgi:hypothetical protein